MISAVMPTYSRIDVAFDRGEGAYLYAQDGRRFLDFGGGVAVTSLGHCHPHLVATLQAQAGRLWHTSNLYNIPGQQSFAERICANSFADTVFFCNSGAEAVEAGIKMVRKYHSETGHPERYRLICVDGAFHGRTLATISAGGQEKMLKGFGPPVDGFDHVGFNNLNEMRAAITPQTGGVLIETVLGEGGIKPVSLDYLRGVRAMCDEYGLLLFIDEVQTGMGRTGKLFAHQWSEIVPDVMAIAKGIAGGFPMGACLATERAAGGMVAGSHGSTFGGNPLAVSVANAVLDVMLADGFMESVQARGRMLWDGLVRIAKMHPHVFAEVRGPGLMLGLRCVPPAGDVAAALREQGLLVVGAGENVVRLLPPLVIGKAEVDEALDIIGRVAASWPKATAA
ncbi:MAG: aspartate aminotransferase family protein [Alphaproteobacteria bacterium]